MTFDAITPPLPSVLQLALPAPSDVNTMPDDEASELTFAAVTLLSKSFRPSTVGLMGLGGFAAKAEISRARFESVSSARGLTQMPHEMMKTSAIKGRMLIAFLNRRSSNAARRSCASGSLVIRMRNEILTTISPKFLTFACNAPIKAASDIGSRYFQQSKKRGRHDGGPSKEGAPPAILFGDDPQRRRVEQRFVVRCA